MIILSILFFISSILFFYRNKTNLNFKAWIYIFFVFLFLSFLDIYYIFNYFTWKWLDNSILYYFFYWWEWTWWFEYEKLFFISSLSFVFIITFIYSYINFYLKRKKSTFKHLSFNNKISYILLFFSFLFNPLVNNILEINWLYDIGNSNYFNELRFEDYYFKPQFTDIEKKKNIVYIYLESYEKTYLNEDIFPWLSPVLNNLKNNSTYFDNLSQAHWTHWTIAWMVWSQCWIPLEIPWSSEDKTELADSYMSKAFCIWDYLKNAWYSLNYVWWSLVWFAWKGTFYRTHWFETVLWKDEYIKDLSNEDYNYSWWLYDDTTFVNAYNKYDELSKWDKPFWLFMITMDTHWDNWVISDNCNWKKYNDDETILNSYKCTDFLLWNFIEKLKDHPSFKNTVIVIGSDHYAMDNNNTSDILKENEDKRGLLFMIYDSDESNDKIINKKWDTLDIWATILSFLWFPVDRLWIWINLLNEKKIRDPNIIISKWKDEYKKFW